MKWWHIAGIFIGGVIIYETAMWAKQMNERASLYAEAEKYAKETNKLFLVVGHPKGCHGCGDVNIDIEEGSECPTFIRGNIEDLNMFQDKQFGSVFVGHVLEHVDNIEKAFNELHRVADKVFIAYPDWYSIEAYIAPDHKWLIYSAPPETGHLEYRRLR